MGYRINSIDDAVMNVTISGVMKLADQQALQHAGAKLIAQGRQLRLLVTLEHFQGWEKGVDWSDVGFLVAHGDDIAKIAIVGDQSWKDQVYAFTGKGFRRTEIEFFPTASAAEAESWVRA